MFEIECKACGKKIMHRMKKGYCDNDVCRSKGYTIREHKRLGIKPIQKICPFCNATFFTTVSQKRFCSNECLRKFDKKYRTQTGASKKWASLSEYVLEEDNYQCRNCGIEKVKLVVHHIIFLCDGGTNKPKNLESLCTKCHGIRHCLN